MWETFVLYSNIYNWGIFLIFIMIYLKWESRAGASILSSEDNSYIFPLIIFILYSLWMGLRPLDVSGWNDTNNYRIEYSFVANNPYLAINKIGITQEWLWSLIEYIFTSTNQPPEFWFLFIEICYMGFTFLALKRLFPYNLSIAYLFFISAFSFYSYSYNTIRAGMACAIVLYGFTYILSQTKKDYIKGILICLVATGIHKSVYLPLICMIASVFTNINFRKSIIWWGLSILLSLIMGSQIQSFFLSIGFDDRMDTYLDSSNISKYQEMFSRAGFRWDFVLYSVMPMILGYYIIFKKGIRDRIYSVILNTYVLSNSFWIMVITAANSDRFAYLSWFMYPVVIAYPLLHLKVWTDQNAKAMNILALYVGFTLFMRIIYYG